jgi:CO/xanthine dehydrogenase Mo-binding subunit
MPYRNPVDLVYGSGDYAAALDRLGRYRGIGFAHYIELNTGDPRERAEITVRPAGRIDVVLGTLSAGQGHETSFPQRIAEWFGAELGHVQLIPGDTDLMSVGLWELYAYDESTGQLAAATLMAYALPRAEALPSFVTELSEMPLTSNPLGLRGGGEGGTTPPLGAVVNAVVDALAEFGVEHLDMPVTPERVWRAIHGGN